MGDIPIVAQLSPKTFTPTLRTPGPLPSDSDDVLLALETAQALELRGDIEEAARWLRRAANEAERQGHDTRVLVLAHAAADLSSRAGQGPAPNAPPRLGVQRELSDSDPAPRRRATPPPLPSRAMPPPLPSSTSSIPAPSRPISSVQKRPMAAEPLAPERKARMGAIRVAVKKPTLNARFFSIERLDADQPLPSGAVEALLVLMGDLGEPPERK